MTAAVLDACVLYPMLLRDTLLRVAAAGAFRLHWSAEILDEMSRNLVADHRMTPEKATALQSQMEAAFPDAIVEVDAELANTLRNHPKDRHVAAAAVAAEADVIVTANLKDFADLPDGIAAVSPDKFLCDRLQAEPGAVLEALARQSHSYLNPPIGISQLLDALEASVPKFAEAARVAYVAQRLSANR